MYKIAIIDDDEPTLNIIESTITKTFDNAKIVINVKCINNPLNLNLKEHFDVLFLDIDMPHIDGIELARRYLHFQNEAMIIFVTNKYDLVFNAFTVHPFDFIKKENLKHGLIRTINHLINKLEFDNNIISIQNKNGITKIKRSQILFCESYGHTCYIHTVNRTVETSKYKLSDLETMINSPDFYMINQSYLVHWKYISEIQNKMIILEDGTFLPISKRRFKNSLASYQKYALKNI